MYALYIYIFACKLSKESNNNKLCRPDVLDSALIAGISIQYDLVPAYCLLLPRTPICNNKWWF